MKAKAVTSVPMIVRALIIDPTNSSECAFTKQANLKVLFSSAQKPLRTPGKAPAAPELAMSWNAPMIWWRDPWAERTLAEKEPLVKVFKLNVNYGLYIGYR